MRSNMPPKTFAVADALEQLEASAHVLGWAAGHLAPELAVRATGAEWGPATDLAHLAVYEERVTLPVIRSLRIGGHGADAVVSGGEGWLARESMIAARAPWDRIVARWSSVRRSLIAEVGLFSEEEFNIPSCTLTTPLYPAMPPHPAGLVVMKAYQHTWEHGHRVLRVARLALSGVPPAPGPT